MLRDLVEPEGDAVPSEAELDAYDRVDPAIEMPPMVEVVVEDIEVVEEKDEDIEDV